MVEGEEQRRITHLDLRNEPQFPMVFVRESTCFAKDDLAIFPPINHENLYVNGLESPSVSSSSSSSSSRLSDSSFSPSDSDEQFQFSRKSHSQPSEDVGKSPWKSVIEIDIIQGWWKILLARVMSNFQNLVTCFSRNSLCSFSKTLRSFYSVMVIFLWWWKRNRTRRRLEKGEIIAAHLRDTIKERDERIAQLLHQITQMNELLVKITHSN
ncbi:unnamed protein product [Arabidopsis thaliana]|uniref:At5g61360 n=2 Tax=Arabidopsis thaliana TaxID=3702 RepID=Q9FLJ7_ARATH|nr:uncharacterized protein AT5G61360 [Arabidopsis thaliana]AAR24702.1 At5g61360 [Arabidopsis thaliana]AAW80872.1 At5g61360 [Arabidopsis thaliana]AED97458.1 hypothetical protein AT5G61360 [Arabidopsis thaliana]CAA0411275.1 unnamed protein product [Arabidopsis thaliana]VYS71065.1 unnamed protein product [Arabidopsis thaliana]|eukprot:NP_200944.2 hypothetical protein AT5G61360 [Arabidopsis thaliana]